jgi:hypothetical protein
MRVRRQIRIATASKQASFYEGYCSTRRQRVLILRSKIYGLPDCQRETASISAHRTVSLIKTIPLASSVEGRAGSFANHKCVDLRR